MSHDDGRVCECVADHRPRYDELNRHHVVPLYAGGPDTAENVVWICPNAHTSVHELLRAWTRHAGEPPWALRRTFSPFIRALAERGWHGIQALDTDRSSP